MSLRASLAKATAAAFTAVGDIATTSTYRRSTTAYVPATGLTTTTNVDTTISAIFTRFSELEVARTAGMQVTDVKMIVQKVALTITPNLQTDHVIYSGKTYNLVNYNPDPSGAIYTFQLRAP